MLRQYNNRDFLIIFVIKIQPMVVVLKKGASKKDIEAIEKALYSKRAAGGFNAKKYNGTIKLKNDPLATQFKLRDEWERDFS